MYKINEIAKLFNISRRTLQFYDEKGLLKPKKDFNGYRMYTEEDIKILSMIMVYKELEIPLETIKDILKSNAKNEMLIKQKDVLKKRIVKYKKTIELIDEIIKEGEIMKKVNEVYNEYKDEAESLYGNTNEYKTSEKRWNSYSDNQKEDVMNEGSIIIANVGKLMVQGKTFDSKEVQALIKDYQDYVTKYFYNMTNEIYLSLADTYIEDERFKKTFEDINVGLAKFYSDAVKYYCEK